MDSGTGKAPPAGTGTYQSTSKPLLATTRAGMCRVCRGSISPSVGLMAREAMPKTGIFNRGERYGHHFKKLSYFRIAILKKLKIGDEIHSHEGRQQEQWKEVWSQKPGFFSGSEAPSGLKEPSVYISSQRWFEWVTGCGGSIDTKEIDQYYKLAIKFLITFQRAGLLAHHWFGSWFCSLLCIFGRVP